MVSARKKDSLILVFGSTGMLGTVLCPTLASEGYRILRQSRKSGSDIVCIDPLDYRQLIDALEHYRPDVVINLVAATDVNECEADLRSAFLANVRVPELLTQAIIESKKHGQPPHLIHISTDHVYDGIGPHVESEALPCNIYALTKYAGELAAIQTRVTVLRTNFIGKSWCAGRVSLSDWLVNSLRSETEITVFDDVLFSAIHTSTLCNYIVYTAARKVHGVFNVGCRDGLSKAQFAQQLAVHLGLDTQYMKTGSVHEGTQRFRRPLDMRMNIRSFEQNFSLTMPTMAEQIKLTAQEYQIAETST